MNRRLCLSNTNKKIAGVCGGVAEYLNMDPTVVRILWILSLFVSGIGLLAYLIAWAIMPRESYGTF